MNTAQAMELLHKKFSNGEIVAEITREEYSGLCTEYSCNGFCNECKIQVERKQRFFENMKSWPMAASDPLDHP